MMIRKKQLDKKIMAPIIRQTDRINLAFFTIRKILRTQYVRKI